MHNRVSKYINIIVITFILFSLVFSSVTSSAENRSFEITEYTIDVTIKPDGSADIKETLVYDFDGEFNGVLRDVDFMATGGLENPGVYVEKKGVLHELKLNSTDNLDAGGENGTYNLVRENDIAHFKIFEKSRDEKKKFVISYTFRDVVTKYNDIAEFNRKIVDSGWEVRLNNVTINFEIPEGALREEIMVFGHGSLLGESKIIDERHVQFTVPYVNPGETVETLVLFPPRLVPQALKIQNRDMLPFILENEAQLAEESNRIRNEARRRIERENTRKLVGNGISTVFIIAWFIILFLLYRKYDREPKPTFEGKYYRELPGEYTPAEMSCLLSMGNVSTRDITATLMDLVRKKQLLLKNEKSIKKGLFRSREVNEYIVSINPNAPAQKLKSHEAFLIDWFIGTIGDGTSVRLDEIAQYAKTASKARRFKKDYDRWCELAKEEAEKNGFFDHTCRKGSKIGMLISIAYLALGILILSAFNAIGGFFMMVQFVFLIIFSARINRRTQYGSEQKAMWDAFRNFLRDFSSMDKAEMPSIVIWEYYLVYAVSLGVAKQVIKQLPLVLREEELQDPRLTYMYSFGVHNSFNSLSNALDRTIDSVDSAINNAMAVANSTLSSKTGGGGGFSTGSSGGAGGRGGGGAF